MFLSVTTDEVFVFVTRAVPDAKCFLSHMLVYFWYKSCIFATKIIVFFMFVT